MMHFSKRLDAYIAQNSGRDLTARQSRRLYSKMRRYDRLTACPTCFQTGRVPCITKSGSKAKATHANRPTLAFA